MLTLLDAVNKGLSYLGLQPVNSLTLGDSEANTIQRVIDEERLFLLSRGEVYNTQIVTLVPDSSGNILVPSSFITTLPVAEKTGIVQRGTHLYDTNNNTDVFDDSVEVRAYLDLPFDDLPYQARNYISLSAMKKALIRLEASPQVIQLVQSDYIMAQDEYERYVWDEDDVNFLDADDLQFVRNRKHTYKYSW